MKKSLRFAGVALLALTIGVFGCDDDDPVAPVAPTVTVTVPPPTPTTPPLVVTMDPPSADVAVGSNVVFAVNASGGAAGAMASWTCASSDTTIATDSVTTSGCQATGVAPGGVTITAVVTKGSETGNVGSQLTVMGPQVGDQAFILIASIKDEFDETTGLKGRVDVQVNVERGDQVLEVLTLLVDGDSVGAQNFGVTAEPAMDEPAAQAIHAFTLSFDSDAYDAVTGDVGYENGDYDISMQLKVAGSEPISSNVLTVDFNNDDGYVVTADLGDNSEIGDDGRRWYGGPSNGPIDITALPVSYSGGSVTSVSANFCGKDLTDLDGSDGYTFEFKCENRESNTDGTNDAVVGEMLAISSAGTDGKILGDNPFPAFVDFVGPSESPIIVANRNGRENGWLNAAVALTGEVDADEDDDENWLVEGADDTGGIGGYNMMLLMGENLEKALDASPGSTLPAESANKDSYCAIASATDDLGNMSELPDDDATCRAPPAGADALVDEDGDAMTAGVWGQGVDGATEDRTMVTDASGQTLKFGVDTTDPTIEFANDYDDNNRHNEIPGPFVFEPEDDESNVGNSGLVQGGGLGSLLVGIQRRTASETECPVIGVGGDVSNAEVDDDCKSVAIDDEDVTLVTEADVGYYTLSGMAQDAAGNSSAAISHTFVYDGGTGAAATATAPSVPGVIEAGEPFEGASFLNDNLSIRDYYGAANFGENNARVLSLGIGKPIAVDEFNASSLTNRNHTVSATVDTYAGLQSEEGGSVQAVSGATVAVRDQTQAMYTSESATFTVDDAPETEDGFPGTSADDGFTLEFQGRTSADGADVYAFCGIEECDDDDAETSVKIEVRARAGASGTFGNPFEKVDFWVTDINGISWMVGSDASGTSGRVGGELMNARYRTWTYSVTLPGTMLNMATRPGIGGNEVPMIRAIAVNDNNVGLLESTGVAIDTMAP